MDFSVTRTSNAIGKYQISTFLSWLVRMGLYGFLLFVIMSQWTFVSFFYTAFLFHVAENEVSMIRRMKAQFDGKAKGGYQYLQVNTLKIFNHRLQYSGKALGLMSAAILIKATVTYICYTNYLPFSRVEVFSESRSEQQRQLLLDFEIDSSENTFTFDTLLFNLTNELVITGLLVLQICLAPKTHKFYKDDLIRLQGYYKKKFASISNIIFAIFIILIPIVSSSPLSMLPLAGYILILFLDYLFVAGKLSKVSDDFTAKESSSAKKKSQRKGQEFNDLLDAPVEDEGLEYHQVGTEGVKKEKEASESEYDEGSDEEQTVQKDSYYIRLIWIPQLLLITSTLFICLLKVQSFSVYTKGIKSIYKSLVFLSTKTNNDLSSNLSIIFSLLSFLFLQYFKECEALKQIRHLLPQSKKSAKQTKTNVPGVIVKTKQGSKNMFDTFFKKKFTSILEIDMKEQVNDFGELRYDYLNDFDGLLNLEKFRKQCVAARRESQSGFAKLKAKMSCFSRRAGNYLLEKIRLASVSVLEFFTNPVLLLFFESILASFFVVFVEPSFFILPLMLWIFLSYIPPLSSSTAIKIKLMLLVIPLMIVCTVYKAEYHLDWNTTANPDFNFIEADHKNLVNSIIGVSIIAVVIIELTAQKILDQGLYKKSLGKTGDSTNPAQTLKKLIKVPYTLKLMLYAFKKNYLFLIVINIYIISININVLNYLLMIFMLKLLLGSKKQKKTIVLIYLTNQVTLIIRYLFVVIKEKDGFADLDEDLVSFLGLMDKDTLGIRKVKIKVALNYLLQYFIFLFLLIDKNEKVFSLEESLEFQSSSVDGSKLRIMFANFKEFLDYHVFWSLPWLCYFVILWVLLYAPINLLNLAQLVLIILMIKSHLFKLSDSNFAGYQGIQKAWKVLRAVSGIKAMLRFSVWFCSKVYLQKRFEFVQKFYNTFHEDYKYVGLAPVEDLKVFLDILPEILTMMLTTLILYRVEVVDYTEKNRTKIEETISDDKFVGYAADISKRVTRLTKISQSVVLRESSHKRKHSTRGMENHDFEEEQKEADDQQQDDRDHLGIPETSKTKRNSTKTSDIARVYNQPLKRRWTNLEEKERHDFKIFCKKRVLGNIEYFKGKTLTKNLYIVMKAYVAIFFLTALFLSTKFKLSFSMLLILIKLIGFYQSVHKTFILECEKQKIDQKIKMKTKGFYHTYLTKVGLESEINADEKKNETTLERQFYIFTQNLKVNFVKTRREKVWGVLTVVLLICITMEYLSYFLEYFGSNGSKQFMEWINLALFMLGWKGYKKNKLADVYGYYLLLAMIAVERLIAKRLKAALKKEILSFQMGDTETVPDNMDAVHLETNKKKETQHIHRFTMKMLRLQDNDAGDKIQTQRESASSTNQIQNKNMHSSILEEKGKFTINQNCELKLNLGFLDKVVRANGHQEKSLNVQDDLEGEQKHYRSKIGKIIFFFSNKQLYLKSKLYQAGIVMVSRLIFLVLLCSYDRVDSFLSVFAIIFVAKKWLDSMNVAESKSSVLTINSTIFLFLVIKYSLGVLDIDTSAIFGEIPTFNTSMMLAFVPKSSPYYKGFRQIINNGLTKYWIFFEAMVFIITQILVLLYCEILQDSSYIFKKNKRRIKHMLKNIIPVGTTQTPLLINFKTWKNTQVNILESVMKYASIYSPILVALIITAASQFYSSLLILLVVGVLLFVAHKLIHDWLLHYMSKTQEIEKLFTSIQILIWIYIIWGIFSRSILGYFTKFPVLFRLTFITSFGLVQFQMIKDMWASKSFKMNYNRVLLDHKFRKLAIPLAKAYQYNEQKLFKIFELMKNKAELDSRIEIMEKQLEIWHIRYKKGEQKNSFEGSHKQKAEDRLNEWGKQIDNVNNEEHDIDNEIKVEDQLLSKVGIFEQLITQLQIYMSHDIDVHDFSSNLSLFYEICRKNLNVVDLPQFGIIDYITGNVKEHTRVIKEIMRFYQNQKESKADTGKLTLSPSPRRTNFQARESFSEGVRATQRYSRINVTGIQSLPEIDHTKASQVIFDRILDSTLELKNVAEEQNSPATGSQKKSFVLEPMNEELQTKKNRESLECTINLEMYGEHIRFYNITNWKIDVSQIYRQDVVQQVFSILRMLPSYLFSNLKNTTLFFILLYCMFNVSLAKVPLLIYTILYGLTEENNLGSKFLKNAFNYICGFAVLKYLLKSVLKIQLEIGGVKDFIPQIGLSLGTNGLSVVQFLFGNIGFDYIEVIALLSIICYSIQSQLSGLFDRFYLDFENINQAFFRLKHNEQLNFMIGSCWYHANIFLTTIRKRIQQKEKQVTFLRSIQDSKSKVDLEEIRSYVLNAKKEHRDYTKYNEVLTMTQEHFEKEMKEFDSSKVSDTNWRLFSKSHRKPGKDFYFLTVILQIILALYTFLFFQNMERTAKSIMDSFSNNLFSGKMTVLLFLQIGFLVYERYLFLINPREWRDWEMFRFQKKQTVSDKEIGLSLLRCLNRNIDSDDLRERFKKIVKRLRFVNRLVGNLSGKELSMMIDELPNSVTTEENKVMADYIHNPQLKRFKYQLFIMIFIYLMTFISIPLIGNSKISGSKLCNSFYKPKGSNKCNYTTENSYLWGFFFLYTIYFIISALQIKYGESFMKNQRKKDRRWKKMNKYINKTITKTPFIYEIKIALDYSISDTAIGLFEWFKFEDVFNQFFEAKFNQLDSDVRPIGQRQSPLYKILFGWCSLGAFLVILFGPLFLFSSFNPIALPNTVNNMALNIGVNVGDAQFELFTNDHPKINRKIDHNEFLEYFSQDNSMINYEAKNIQVIEMYSFSDKTWEITLPMYQTLRGQLYNALSDQSSFVELYYTLEVDQVSGKKSYTKKVQITTQQILVLHQLLTKCGSTKLIIPDFYYMLSKMNYQLGPKDYLDAGKRFKQAMILSAECKKITNDKGETEEAVDYWIANTGSSDIIESVQTQNLKAQSVKNSKSNPDSQIENEDGGLIFITILDTYSKSINSMFSSIIAIYTGFVLIIGNLIRSSFTNQSLKLWLTDVASAEQMIRICEGITAARIDGDLMKEEKLYWELIDLMRSPEMVKSITKSNLEHKLKVKEMAQPQNKAQFGDPLTLSSQSPKITISQPNAKL